MKKRFIIIPAIAVVAAACFIPVTQEQTVPIKGSYFDTYQHLAKAANWKLWRSDLRTAVSADSSQVTDAKENGGFSIQHGDMRLHVNAGDGNFLEVDEQTGNKNYHYGYTILPGKIQNQCAVTTIEKPSLFNFLLGKVGGAKTDHSHILEFKHFMETPDLYYGYEIRKIKALDTCIVVLRKMVPAKDKFTEAARMLNSLQKYVSKNGWTRTQPLMAQFLPNGKDSVQVNIGLPINKKVNPGKPFDYMTMPAAHHLYSVVYKGTFTERQKAYAAMYQFYKDRDLQLPLLPVEHYLDNQLPVNDSSRVNVQILFGTY